MSTQHARQLSRRKFLAGLTLTGTAGLLGLHPRPVAAEPPPETTRIRLAPGRAIRDLKGKTVAVSALGAAEHVFLASMAAYVGLDPRKDITWVTHPSAAAEAGRLLAEGKIDAFLAFPPFAQELRAKQVGHVVL